MKCLPRLGISIRHASPFLLISLTCGVVALPLVGCASADQAGTDTTATAAQRSGTTGETTTGRTSATATDQTAQAQAAPGQVGSQSTAPRQTLGDAEILGVVKVANESEVAAGQLAVQKASTPEVREFAQGVVKDHSQATQQINQTAAATPPANSQMSSSMVQEANHQIASLNKQSGKDFDRAYIESQVKMHQDLLGKIQNELLPKVQKPEIRQLLESMRDKVAEHLKEAQQLQQQMASVSR